MADPFPAVKRDLSVVLISTYELGHQPFGVASPAAWLREAGIRVTCLDLAVQALDEDAIKSADVVAFYLPMHTATRMAASVMPRVRRLNPGAHLCAYGLYAPMNHDFLVGLGVGSVIGGEFEEPMADMVRKIVSGRGGRPAREPVISLGRQQFIVPDRSGLPPLSNYAELLMPDGASKTVGYTEASRGCKHLCRHCPIVPVYGGRFRVVQADVVAADIAQQVAAGAQHITFGDPDFLNAPGHALAVVRALHSSFPWLTYDATIKIEHLVRHERLVPELRDTGCILVTSAVESFAPDILTIFDKQHTLEDFERALRALRASGITLNPTFVAFTPWTTTDLYVDFLATIHRLRLIGHVAPIQYAIRLLIPKGSRLLELQETRTFIREFDPDGLCYRWEHPDPRMDELQARLLSLVSDEKLQGDRPKAFERIRDEVLAVADARQRQVLLSLDPGEEAGGIPQLSEPWYCCAEPVDRTAPAI